MMCSRQLIHETDIPSQLQKLCDTLDQKPPTRLAIQKYPTLCAQEYENERLVNLVSRSGQDLKRHSVRQSRNLFQLAQLNQ